MRRSAIAVLLLLCSLDAAAAVTGRVIDEEGQPVRGARVRVFAPEPYESFLDRAVSDKPAPVPLASAETGDTGTFRFDTKQPVLVVHAGATGRAFTQAEVADGDDLSIVLRAAPLRRGRITAGGKGVAGANLIIDRFHVIQSNEDGSFELPDPSVWAARIFVVHRDYAIADSSPRKTGDKAPSLDIELIAGKAISGNVIDAQNRPVANAVVRLNGFPSTRSAEDGTFTIAHAGSDARLISAHEGDRAGSLEITAETASAAIRLARTASITGSVRSKDDTPVSGMRVSVFGNSGWWRSEAISDAKGNFTLAAIEPGIYRLGMSHPAYFSGAPASIRLAEGARENRTLYVTALPRVTGVVVDESKKPVGAARVRIYGGGFTTTTAPDGTFSLRVPPGPRAMTIEASKRSYATATWGPVHLEPGEVRTDARIVLQRGLRFEMRLVDADGVAIADEPLMILRRIDPDERFNTAPIRCDAIETAECLTDREGKLFFTIGEGKYEIRAGGKNTVLKELAAQTLSAEENPMTITLERGAPIEGRLVWSDGTPVDVPARVTSAGRSPLIARVTDGTFALRNAPAGKISIVAQSEGPMPLQSDAVEVNAPASGIVLTLPRPGRIEGRVTERQSEKAVREFQVSAEVRDVRRRGRPASPKLVRADDGKFLLEGVPPGTVDVIVSAPGYVRATISDVAIETGKTASVAVALDRGGSVVGRVTAAGRPLPDASVVVDERPGGFMPFRVPESALRTDANGEFRIEALAPGTQRIEIQREGYVTKIVAVNVTAGSEVRADADLERGHEVRGRVVDAEGRGMPHVDVQIRSATGPRFGRPVTTTDAAGAFRLTGLAPEAYTISARKQGFVEESVDVNPPATQDVTLTLRRGGTITGRVLGLTESELAFVDISVSGMRGMHARTQPDATGAFTLSGVPDGEITLHAVQQRPRMRQVRSGPVTVVNGTAPPVDLDFGAGIVVSGRVTRKGEAVSGWLSFSKPDRDGGHVSTEVERDGTYEAIFTAPGDYDVRISLSPGNSVNAGKISVREAMRHDIEIRGANVAGRVIDAMTREPVSGAQVSVAAEPPQHPFWMADRRSDALGKFAIELVADGRWVMRVHKEGYVPERRDLFVQNEHAPDVEIALTRGETAMIRVIGPDASITVSDEAKQVVFSGQTPRDAEGVQRVSLRPGRYTLHVFAPDYKPATATLIVPGPLVEVRLERR